MKHRAVFALKLTGNVVLVNAFHIWTVADAKDYVRQLRALVQPLIHQPWAIIMDTTRWEMSPADVFVILQDNTRWCFERKLMMAVTILPDDQLLQWQFAKATSIEKPEGFISQIAVDIDAARKQVRAAGFLAVD